MSDRETVSDSEINPIPVFWTGGRDSTFRVLDLIFQHGCRVQPIYVIDRTRKSFQLEIDAMDRIRDQIAQDSPTLIDLLLETIFLKREDMEATVQPGDPYFKLARASSVSPQYPYLANAVVATGFERVEVSVQPGDNVTTIPGLKERLIEVHHECGPLTYQMRPSDQPNQAEDSMALLERFWFPTFFTLPLEMDVTAEKYGFLELLDYSWTCQVPFFGQPCGMCQVCRYAIQTNKLRGYPPAALTRYKYRKVLNPIHIFVNHPMRVIKKAVGYLPFRQSDI